MKGIIQTMATPARAKTLLDSFDVDVEGLKGAVDKLTDAAERLSEDQGQTDSTKHHSKIQPAAQDNRDKPSAESR